MRVKLSYKVNDCGEICAIFPYIQHICIIMVQSMLNLLLGVVDIV